MSLKNQFSSKLYMSMLRKRGEIIPLGNNRLLCPSVRWVHPPLCPTADTFSLLAPPSGLFRSVGLLTDFGSVILSGVPSHLSPQPRPAHSQRASQRPVAAERRRWRRLRTEEESGGALFHRTRTPTPGPVRAQTPTAALRCRWICLRPGRSTGPLRAASPGKRISVRPERSSWSRWERQVLPPRAGAPSNNKAFIPIRNKGFVWRGNSVCACLCA